MRNELGRIKTFLPTNELVEDERNEDLKKESMELSWSVKGDLLEKKDVCSYAFNNTGERYSYLIPHTVSYRGSTIPSRPVPPYFFFSYTVPSRDETVRYGTIFIPHIVSLCLLMILLSDSNAAERSDHHHLPSYKKFFQKTIIFQSTNSMKIS